MYGNGFFNPYMYQPYYQASNLMNGLGSMRNVSNLSRAASLGNTGAGGLRGLLGKFSFSSFLNGASKTLNVVNQAIPIFYQVKPMINNAKTMFRIMGAVKDDDSNNKSNHSIKTEQTAKNENINTSTPTASNKNYQTFNEENPTFFI